VTSLDEHVAASGSRLTSSGSVASPPQPAATIVLAKTTE
jgi:hypothetical protein